MCSGRGGSGTAEEGGKKGGRPWGRCLVPGTILRGKYFYFQYTDVKSVSKKLINLPWFTKLVSGKWPNEIEPIRSSSTPKFVETRNMYVSLPKDEDSCSQQHYL